MLLDSYLHHLRLPSFIQYHQAFAQDALQNNQSYQDYLFALVRQEASERDRKREQQRIRAAKLPALKELSDFNFSAVPALKPQRILDLARG
jgi:DNA replication protein DnaC